MKRSLKKLMDTEKMAFLWIFLVTIAIILMVVSVVLLKLGKLSTGIALLGCTLVIMTGCAWILKSLVQQ